MKFRKFAAQTSRASVLSKAKIKKVNTSPATALKDIVFTTLPKENVVSTNAFGIQMIPKSLQSKLFSEPTKTLEEKAVKQCLSNLNKFELNQVGLDIKIILLYINSLAYYVIILFLLYKLLLLLAYILCY